MFTMLHSSVTTNWFLILCKCNKDIIQKKKKKKKISHQSNSNWAQEYFATILGMCSHIYAYRHFWLTHLLKLYIVILMAMVAEFVYTDVALQKKNDANNSKVSAVVGYYGIKFE